MIWVLRGGAVVSGVLNVNSCTVLNKKAGRRRIAAAIMLTFLTKFLNIA